MAYRVFCRECDWLVPDPVDLKGEANLLAGKHISDTGHSVKLEEVETEDATKSPNFGWRPGGAESG